MGIFFGQNTSFELVSQTHGRKRLKFVESFEVDPSHTNKRLWFFNSKEMLPVSIYEGASGSFGYLETEEKYFLAMVMDQDPNALMLNDDPGAYLEFCMLLNSRDERGKQRNGILVKGARIAGVPESMAPREEQHSRCGFLAKTRYKIKNGGILYTRILGATPAGTVFSTPDDIKAVVTYTDVAGAGTVSSSTTTVTGVGTAFLTGAVPGDTILAGGQRLTIATVDSDTSLTTTAAASPALSAATYTFSAPPTCVAALPQLPSEVNIFDATTKRNWLAVYKNGIDMTQEAIDNPGLFSVTSTPTGKVVFPTELSATDVWEFYIPYYVA